MATGSDEHGDAHNECQEKELDGPRHAASLLPQPGCFEGGVAVHEDPPGYGMM